MKQEIKKFIQMDQVKDKTSIDAAFCFHPSFRGFNGHFLGQPVLPGVCLVQAVLVAAELALDKKLNLIEITLTKFFALTLPTEKLSASIHVDEQTLRAKISRDGERIADIRLKVDYA